MSSSRPPSTCSSSTRGERCSDDEVDTSPKLKATMGDEPETLTALPDLSRTGSNRSRHSNHTFADAAALVNLDLRAPSPTVRPASQISAVSASREKEYKQGEGVSEVGKGEEFVAVQVVDGEEIVYPDGGLQAWLVVVGGFFAALCAFGLAASVGAFQTYYEANMLSHYSSSTIAWIGSAQAAVCFSMCLFTGPLFDRYGCRPLLAVGSFLLVLGFCMLSLSTQYYQIFLCHAILLGTGMDLLFIVPLACVGQWFSLRRGLAFGILMTGSSVGAIVWPAIVANLPSKVGFGWTVRIMALLVAVFGGISTILLRTRLPPRPPGPFFHLGEFKNIAYTCMALSNPFFVFAFFSFLIFIGTYGTAAGLGTLAPYLLMITNGASGFGRIFGGMAADVLGPFNVAVLCMTVMIVFMFLWLVFKSAGALIALCAILGFFSGPPISLQGPLITKTATNPRIAGTLIGQALVLQSITQLCGPPIFGVLVGTGTPQQMMSNFPKAIIFGACMMIVATICVAGARFRLNRKLLAIV